MIGRHYQDDALAVPNPSAGEEANRLPDESFIRVRINNMAARMRIC
jgi:hypothetical protein